MPAFQFIQLLLTIQMNQLVQKIKYFVQKVPRDQGIIGLIKLQNQAPQNMKYKCRVACLHLIEMNHDWDSIRKLIVQWSLVRTFGKDLVVRMRKRVNQQPSQVSDEQDVILKELDRLNQKNWRQYSPKKNFPDLTRFLTQSKPKQAVIKQQKVFQQSKKQQSSQGSKIQRQEGSQRQRSSNMDSNSIFARLSQLQKNDKNREKEVLPKGVFTKLQKSQSNQNIDKRTIGQKSSRQMGQRPKQRQNSNQPNQQIRKKQDSNQNHKSTQSQQSKSSTPSKQVKKIVMIKYGQEKQRQKIKQQSKDQFSFSVVKARQVPSGFSQKKQMKIQQLDNSFLNFTNDSKIKQRNQIFSEKKQNVLEEIIKEEQFLKQSRFINTNKPLFTQQELSLIQLSNPPKNYIKQILKAEGKGAIDMLRSRLQII